MTFVTNQALPVVVKVTYRFIWPSERMQISEEANVRAEGDAILCDIQNDLCDASS
jgi:hypothetical protein